MEEQSLYHYFGGESFVQQLVHAFYERVFRDQTLHPLFINSDKEEVKHKQFLFLSQFLGGPGLYSVEYGHPMLRARHLPFEITPSRAEAWLRCMFAAMDDIQLAQDEWRMYLQSRFTQVAQHMVNQPETKEGQR